MASRKRLAPQPKKQRIFPIILAAGKPPRLGFPQALAKFGKQTALEIAVENCAGLGMPIIVLGYCAAEVRAEVPPGARVAVNRRWRSGQLSSLRAGLRYVPRSAAFLVYPVDHPLLTAGVIRRLVAGFRCRKARQAIAVPIVRGRAGHPVIFSDTVRAELARANSAREVVQKDPQRVKLVPVGTQAIWMDFGTPAAYRKCRRILAKESILH